MKAPDKIYLRGYASKDSPVEQWSADIIDYGFFGPLVNVEYIRKDALLEWAKEMKEQVCSLHPKNRDATCARDGMLTIIDNIFDKLNNF